MSTRIVRMTVKIDLEGSLHPGERHKEVGRILKFLGAKIELSHNSVSMLDYWGRTSGSIEYEFEEVPGWGSAGKSSSNGRSGRGKS